MSEVKDNFGKDLMRHWPLVICLASILISWGVFSNRIANSEAEIMVMKAKQDKTDDTIQAVQGGIIRIETSLDFIKEKLDGQY